MGVTRKGLRGLSLAATIEAATGPAFRDAPGYGRSWRPSQPGHRPLPAGAAALPGPLGYAVVPAASVTPAAFAALRTAPATAPATLSLKTLGMM